MRKNTKTTNATAIAISAAIGSSEADNAHAAAIDSASRDSTNPFALSLADSDPETRFLGADRADLPSDVHSDNAVGSATGVDQSPVEHAPLTENLSADFDSSSVTDAELSSLITFSEDKDANALTNHAPFADRAPSDDDRSDVVTHTSGAIFRAPDSSADRATQTPNGLNTVSKEN